MNLESIMLMKEASHQTHILHEIPGTDMPADTKSRLVFVHCSVDDGH